MTFSKLVLSSVFLALVYTFQTVVAIDFKTVNLTHPNGTDFEIPNVVSVEFVPQSEQLMVLAATFFGNIYLLEISHPSPYRYIGKEVASITVPDGRSVLDVTTDPFSNNIFFVCTAIAGFPDRGLPQTAWNNGQIHVLKLFSNNEFHELRLGSSPLISGLPVSNNTLSVGVYATAAAADGSLFISQGLHTNAGAPAAPSFQEDSFYSGTILNADIRTSGKTLTILWDSNVITEARPKNVNESGISVYATGFRSIFEPIISTRGDLFASDGGGDPFLGPRSVSCTEDVPLQDTQPDRLFRVRRGVWYGAANRARGQDDPKYCVHLWGDESNLTEIQAAYPDFRRPYFITTKALNNNVLSTGSVGLVQYLPNWFSYLRKKFIGTELDVTVPRPGNPSPIMYVADIWRRRLFKIADAPGLSTAVDRYGSIFVGQFNLGKIAIAVPVVKNWMKKKPMIRNVWPSRGLPRSKIWIIGTNMPEAAIKIDGKGCRVSERQRYLDLQLVSCFVPNLPSYSVAASTVRVGNLSLEEAFTVLPPDVSLSYSF